MLTRRDFFRGTMLGAGAIYLSPFLDQLEGATAGKAKPMRFVFFLQGNGMYPEQIQPKGIERPKQPTRLEDRPLKGHTLASSLAPLEPWKDRMTFLAGLSSRVARGSHSSDFGAMGCYPQNKGAFGPTVDAQIAKALPGIFSHVGLGVQSKPEMGVIYNVSAWARDKKLPTQCKPEHAYKQLFSVAATGEDRKAFDAKTSVLDFMADDVKRLQARLNSTEKAKLDHYLGAFESMSRRQAELARAADKIRKYAPRSGAGLSGDGKLFERLESQFDIAAGAILAGLTNVVTISSGSGLQFSACSVDGTDIGLPAGPIGSHAIGHGKSYFGKSSGELHSLIRLKHIEKLAGFLKKLESIPEGEGTMLDNTLVIYTSDSGDSHHPLCYEWPFLLIGDLGGRLKTKNRYLRYPWYGNTGHRTVANLYSTLLKIAGKPCDRFGLPDIALKDINQEGPLEELLV